MYFKIIIRFYLIFLMALNDYKIKKINFDILIGFHSLFYPN